MKRLISFLMVALILTMMVPMLAVNASAADEVVVKTSSELKTILEDKNKKEVNIKLGGDISDSILSILTAYTSEKRSIEIDLNGYGLQIGTLTVSRKNHITIYDGTETPGTLKCDSINVMGTFCVYDVTVDIVKIKNCGIAYIAGKSVANSRTQTRLYAETASIMMILEKDIVFDETTSYTKSRGVILLESKIKLSKNEGMVVQMDFAGEFITPDDFVSYAESVFRDLERDKQTIDLPSPTRSDGEFVKWIDRNGNDVKSVSFHGKVSVSAVVKYTDAVKVDANGGTCDVLGIAILNDGKLVGKLPVAERDGYCLDGWCLNDKVVSEDTKFKKGDTIKAKWVPITDKSDEITKALLEVGVSKNDINKFLDMFKSANLTGSMFIGKGRPSQQGLIPVPYVGSNFNGPQATVVAALVVVLIGVASVLYCLKHKEES